MSRRDLAFRFEGDDEGATGGAVGPGLYSEWKDPIFALRDALSRDATQVERDRTIWTAWLHERGLPVRWERRVSVDDVDGGVVEVTQDAHEYIGPSPQVYGEIEDPDKGALLALVSQGGRFWRTQNARVVGGWDVVKTPHGACWPALSHDTDSILVSNGLDSRLLGWTPSSMILRADRRRGSSRVRSLFGKRTPRRVDRAIALVGEHSAQYGHFLIDYLARALAAQHLPTSIPVLIDADVPSNSRWWLTHVLPNRAIVPIESARSVEVRDLFVPLQRTFCPTGWIDSLELTPDVWSSDPTSVSQIQHLVTTAVEPTTRYRRVWLGKRGRNKALANQQELFDRMAAHGFELVYPEDLPMRALQKLLTETKDVIAPVGSQVLNVIATPPGLRVLVLLGEAMIQTRGSTAVTVTASGHELALVGGHDVGPPGRNPYERKQRSFTVDSELLEAASGEFFGS